MDMKRDLDKRQRQEVKPNKTTPAHPLAARCEGAMP